VDFMMFAKNILLGSLSFATVLMVGNWSGAIAQSRIIWRQLSQAASPRIAPLTPSKFLSGFENGEMAVTASNNYRTAYVVAKQGVSLNVNSTVGGLSRRGGSFMQVEDEARSLPAIADFPQNLYDSSQIIEIIYNAPRDGGEKIRNIAKQSRKATLSNGKTAYYMKQWTGRTGWCVFTDVNAEYSDFTCVNIANSPKAALTVMDALPLRRNGLIRN
jgi:hypothetical protein